MTDGRIACFFAAQGGKGNTKSVGVAFSTKGILGPYVDSGRPLVHNTSIPGDIDPTYFRDADDRQYLIWKLDGDEVQPWHAKIDFIMLAELSNTSDALVGKTITLLANDLAWEGPTIEAPWLVANAGFYYLFYRSDNKRGRLLAIGLSCSAICCSGARYNTAGYAVGVARATSVRGPYVKQADPVLRTGRTPWAGPGHCSVVVDPTHGNASVIVYHAWPASSIGSGPRMMLMDKLTWDAPQGWPQVATGSPSASPQPVP